MRLALAMALKDVRLTLFRSAGLVQALLLGLLLVFMFSLSQKAGERVSAQTAATIFWLASSFCQVLVFNAVYAYEETAGQRLGLLLAPAPTAAVWLGKAMAGFVLVFLSQLVFLPATAVFLAQEPSHCLAEGLAMLVLADTGLAALGSLLGALAQGQAARESLLSLLVCPLLVPLLLSAISVFAAVFGDAAPDGVASWLGFAGAFDAIFLGAGLLLFRFIYTGEE